MAAIRCSSPYARYLSPSYAPGINPERCIPASAPRTKSALSQRIPRGRALTKLCCQPLHQLEEFGTRALPGFVVRSKHTDVGSIVNSIQPVKSSISSAISALNIEFPQVLFRSKRTAKHTTPSVTDAEKEQKLGGSFNETDLKDSTTFTSSGTGNVQEDAQSILHRNENVTGTDSTASDLQSSHSQTFAYSEDDSVNTTKSIKPPKTCDEPNKFLDQPWRKAVGLQNKITYDEQFLEIDESIRTFHNERTIYSKGPQQEVADATLNSISTSRPYDEHVQDANTKWTDTTTLLKETVESGLRSSPVLSYASTSGNGGRLDANAPLDSQPEVRQNIWNSNSSLMSSDEDPNATVEESVKQENLRHTVVSPVDPLVVGNASNSESSPKKSMMAQVKDMLPAMPTMMTRRSSKTAEPAVEKVKPEVKNKPVVPRGVINQRTRELIGALRIAYTGASRLHRVSHLGKHLQNYPAAKGTAILEGVIPLLLKLRDIEGSADKALREQAMETLALVGYVAPVQSRGVRVLTLDGGGTRGLISLALMARIEEICQQPIHLLFDYIGGVSTGSLIAAIVGLHKRPLDEAVYLYKRFSCEMFNQNKLTSWKNFATSQAIYASETWEKILQENIGHKTFLEMTHDPVMPKVAAISCVINRLKATNYIFRNYTYMPGRESEYPGSIKYTLWEAIRASSAAPFYFPTKKLDQCIHQDGGLLTNNPTAIALHECRQLWPTEPIHCVVSLGTGRYQPILENNQEYEKSQLTNQIRKFVESATDTEAVHNMLQNLLPPNSYFRLNPFLSENIGLDETNTDKWDLMQQETDVYCQQNDLKLRAAAKRLLDPRSFTQRSRDNLALYKERDLPRVKNWLSNKTCRSKKYRNGGDEKTDI